jgi:excisionase family DNA binding protein
MLTIAQAAEKLGVSRQRVQALVAAKRLRATKFGNVYVIQEADLRRLKIGPVGWPKGRPRGSRKD